MPSWRQIKDHLKAYIESVEGPLHGVLVYTFRTSAVVSGKDQSRVGVNTFRGNANSPQPYARALMRDPTSACESQYNDILGCCRTVRSDEIAVSPSSSSKRYRTLLFRFGEFSTSVSSSKRYRGLLLRYGGFCQSSVLSEGTESRHMRLAVEREWACNNVSIWPHLTSTSIWLTHTL
jgi:hypothetical protein